MKRIFLIALLLLIVIVLVGCGAPNTSPPSASPSTPASQEPSQIPTPSPSPSPSPSKDLSNQIGSGSIGNIDVSIVDFKLSKDYEDNPAAIITYEWTNNTDEAASFLFAVDASVFQGGVECETAIIMSNDDYDSELSMTEIKPGTTFTVQSAYLLRDTTSPIEVEVTELFSFEKNPPVVKKTFDIA